MDELFLKMIPIILNNECGKTNGYVNDKDDNGGETIFGVTRKYYPFMKIWTSIDMLPLIKDKKAYKPTEEEMEEIFQVYYKNYYKPCNINLFENKELGLHVFDMAVNAGVKAAVKLLQRLLRITPDGICGKQTIATANVKTRVLDGYIQQRIDYYVDISKKGNNKKFLNGWLARVSKTKFVN